MSQIEKLLLPLIDDNITLDEINNNKFIGVFTDDVNSPGLDYIYLVFVYDIENLHPKLAINGIDSVKRIGDNLFHVYKFPRVSVDLKKLLKGEYRTISNEGISKIYNFWKSCDEVTANYPFARTVYKEQYYRIIPEEKFVPLCERKEPKGFTVEKQ